MFGGAASCINIVVASRRLAWRARITDCSNNEAYHSLWRCMSYCLLRKTSAPPPFRWRQNHQPKISNSLTYQVPRFESLQRWLRRCLKPMVYHDYITSPSDRKKSVERHVRYIPQLCCLQQSNTSFYVSRWQPTLMDVLSSIFCKLLYIIYVFSMKPWYAT